MSNLKGGFLSAVPFLRLSQSGKENNRANNLTVFIGTDKKELYWRSI
jgi:hypothetical protein